MKPITPTAKKASHSERDKQNKDDQKKKGCDIGCPFFKLLVPPCWFLDD